MGAAGAAHHPRQEEEEEVEEGVDERRLQGVEAAEAEGHMSKLAEEEEEAVGEEHKWLSASA